MPSFDPPVRLLLGPGPSEVPARVLAAQAKPTIGHLDPAFVALMDEVRAGLSRAFRAPDHACLPLSGPGTAGMEAAMLNLLEPGEIAVVAINGVFGQRLAEMAERAGADVVRVEHPWGEPVDPARVEAALWARGAKLLAFVHAETSTGVMSDPGPLCALAREHGALSVVDCVTSLGGIAVSAAEWGADVLYSGTQKCLSAPPGLAPFALGPRARDAIAARKTKPRTWLYDVGLLMSYWDGGGGGPTTTPPPSTPSMACTRRWSPCSRRGWRRGSPVTAAPTRASWPGWRRWSWACPWPRPTACRSSTS